MYATVQNFIDHYQIVESSELQNIDGETTETNTRLIEALLAGASEINQIIGIRYVMPIEANVPFLKWANIVIARKNLDSFDEREKTRADYDDIIVRLKEMVDGTSILIDANGIPVPQRTQDIVQNVRGKMYSGNRMSPVIDFSGKSINWRRDRL